MKIALLCTMIVHTVVFSAIGQSSTVHLRKLNHISIAFTNAHSQIPFGSFSKLFYTEWHPGVEIGTGFTWASKPHHDWIQNFRLGYFYHAFIQHSISLYTEGGYAYKFPYSISAIAKLGVGYMQAIPDSKILVLDGNKGYEVKSNWGRSQAIFNFDIGVQKQISKSGFRIFLEYQQRFQIPFIPTYVTILPYNIILFGCHVPLHQ